MKKQIILTGLGLLLAFPAFGLTGREIMEQVDKVARSSSESSFMIMKLSSCKFAKRKKVKCAEKPRVKKLESAQIATGKTKLDSKSISIVLEPSSERGIGMLSFAYDEKGKDSESWLYLSALGKVKRLASGSDEDSEPTAFFGSEFTTEDMETGKLDEYNYKIIKETKLGKRPVWIVESTPTAARIRKSRYSKTISWIDKERFLTLKLQSFDKRGKAYKRLSFFKVQKVSGVWLARSIVVMNLQTQRLSQMRIAKIALNIKAKKDFFTQRSLTDFAFREKNLKALRKQME
jgi:hypothetical protein